jgi:hypothetical protein
MHVKIGDVFGLLTIVKETNKKTSRGKAIFQCKCFCGKEIEKSLIYLLDSRTIQTKKSCGCEAKKTASKTLSEANRMTEKELKKLYPNIIKDIGMKEKMRVVLAMCPICKTGKETQTSSILNAKKHNREWMCEVCRRDNVSCVVSKRVKLKNNTSGYIGVYLRRNSLYKRGEDLWVARIKHQGKLILVSKREDSDEGLLSAAIDRDIYIVEHGLPHRRNFDDLELFEKIKSSFFSENIPDRTLEFYSRLLIGG